MKWLVASLLVFAEPAFAASCAQRGDVIANLESKYGERLRFGGLQKSRGAQTVLEVWASDENGTYTVLLTNPNGISCIVAAGTDFFEAVPREEPAGSPM